MPKVSPETALGGAALLGSILSVSMGYPTGLMGQAYWQNEALIIGGLGAFGVLSILMFGGVAVALVMRNKDKQLRRTLVMQRLDREKRAREVKFQERFRRLYRRR
eukprot:Gregarina_sp_Poly_1__2308@NODE_1616_length_3712_cov_1006_655693_g1063_i0_p5_GENE_NODE_1616_length_3712_cov_1006_655693_g1063_i0NODE_1616_length_3712_cov_1006_655693_g1063_i0_p5_ORF_typecomplete_len105_score13_58LMBR1/PF04791_16/0_14_NODE_1616_length_3712_cov_1006_655693_g1063_i018392153